MLYVKCFFYTKTPGASYDLTPAWHFGNSYMTLTLETSGQTDGNTNAEITAATKATFCHHNPCRKTVCMTVGMTCLSLLFFCFYLNALGGFQFLALIYYKKLWNKIIMFFNVCSDSVTRTELLLGDKRNAGWKKPLSVPWRVKMLWALKMFCVLNKIIF